MKTIDRIIFATIAVALAFIAARPFFADAARYQDVNIAAVGGKQISYGDSIPVAGKPPQVGIPKPVR